jgi:hypothetical protein
MGELNWKEPRIRPVLGLRVLEHGSALCPMFQTPDSFLFRTEQETVIGLPTRDGALLNELFQT